MKKFLLVLVVLSGAALSASAQSTFGIKGGVNFATLSGSVFGEDASSSSLTSFHAGVFGDFKLSESFSIQPALLFTQLGNKATGTEEGVSFTGKATFNYLQLPVNAVYWVPTGSGQVFFGAGPFVGYALSGKTKLTASAGGESASVSEDIEFEEGGAKRTNFGVGALAGYKLENGLSLNVGYDLGLSNISDAGGESVKTRAFTVSLGFAF